MNNPINLFMDNMIDWLKKYKQEKEKEGLIPTVELLIEDLENKTYHV